MLSRSYMLWPRKLCDPIRCRSLQLMIPLLITFAKPWPWLWGDDCRYGKKFNQKVMVCMMGHVLDRNRDSYSSCFPLWVCGCDS